MKKNIINKDLSLVAALKLMDEVKSKLLIIVDKDNKFKGVLSLGDIQRAIIHQKSLESSIFEVLREIITIATEDQDIEEIKSIMLRERVEAMPLIDSNGYLKDVLYWEDLIGTEYEVPIKSINLPVVIMAGGIGTRLKPLTNVIPKPLIPLGEKTMIEIIIDSYAKYNCKDFYISVNYKADILKFYLDSVIDKSISIHYFQEDMPLGTAGSLTLIKDKINTTFFVSNCDIIIKNDYEEILKYHRENNNELTIVAAVKDFSIPYGTIELSNNGLLKSMTEKPSFHFLINSGMYILEPHLLKEIPTNEFYHITYLIDRLLKEDRRVGVFPVSEKSWIDIGDWKEYMKQLNLS